MARQRRLDVPGVPQHVVQRGVNRSVCFCDDLDREYYLAVLREAGVEHGCDVHAYVLMTNHVHLLVTGHSVGSLSSMMQMLGRNYVGRFNRRFARTGTLWEGRFKSSLVDSERYVMACYRYIELNPVRARMVERPDEYHWSSVHYNALGRSDPVVVPHDVYLAQASKAAERREAYRTLLDQGISEDELESIRAHVSQGRALGSDRFQREIEELTGQTASLRSRGRPKGWRKCT